MDFTNTPQKEMYFSFAPLKLLSDQQTIGETVTLKTNTNQGDDHREPCQENESFL